MSSYTSFVALLALFFVTSTIGHSQMRCANYDMATGNCLAPIRDWEEAYQDEDNDITAGGGTCQSSWTNPITASYNNGAGCPSYLGCPGTMGSLQQGQNFTIMWLARNHAEADETPGNIFLYLSPVEDANQGVDTSTSVFMQNQICQAPFMSCGGQNGNFVQCYATCQMPATSAVGIHTLWWKWPWTGHTSIYTTCADIYVTAASGSVTPAPAPITPSSTSTTAAKPKPSSTSTSTSTSAAVAPQPSSTSTSTSSSTTAHKAISTSTSTSTTAAAQKTTSTSGSAPSTPVSTSSTSATSTGCNLGNQICVGSNQYQTCTNGRDATYWAQPQNCQAGLSCMVSARDNTKIYCQ